MGRATRLTCGSPERAAARARARCRHRAERAGNASVPDSGAMNATRYSSYVIRVWRQDAAAGPARRVEIEDVQSGLQAELRNERARECDRAIGEWLGKPASTPNGLPPDACGVAESDVLLRPPRARSIPRS